MKSQLSDIINSKVTIALLSKHAARQQGFVFVDFLTCVLDRHIGELPESQTFLPTHIAVPMLKELPASLTNL